jgi:Zn-dependent metalloprotease
MAAIAACVSVHAQNKINLSKVRTVDGSKITQGQLPPYMSVPKALPKLQSSNSNTTIYRNEANRPIFVKASVPLSKDMDIQSPQGIKSACNQFLDQIAATLQVQDPSQEFEIRKFETDKMGYTHVFLQQTYKNIPIYNAQSVVHFKGQNAVFNGQTIATPLNVPLQPAVPANKALSAAMASLNTQTSVQPLSDTQQKLLNYTEPVQELVIYPSREDNSKLNLAWHFTIRPNMLERWEYFVDAITGEILFKYNNTWSDGPATTTAVDLKGNTRTVNSYNVSGTYYLLDASKSMFNATGSTMPDYPLGAIRTLDANNTDLTTISYLSSSTNSWTNPTAVSAHCNAGICYDYYLKTFGRKSLDGNGGNIISLINVTYNNAPMENAYWNGSVMAYGNGNVVFSPLAKALDVSGHELTHGVVQNTANLEYLNQSGAINESMADVFGAMIERQNWTIGEDITNKAYFPSGSLRDMSNPHNGSSAMGNGWQPENMKEYVNTTDDNGGVHVNSGIPNRAYYLLATSTSKDSAEQIYYRALTVYLTRSSQFIDLRLAVIQSATDLFGANSKEVTAAKNAFDAVQIYDGQGSNHEQDLSPNIGLDWILVTNPYNKDTLYTVRANNVNYKFKMSLTRCFRKPTVTDDGKTGYFIPEDHTIHGVFLDTTKVNESVIENEKIWKNVAISKDGNKIALVTTQTDTSIIVYDLTGKKGGVRYHLYSPTFTRGVTTGGPLFADAIEFDATGQYILYDAYNQIKTQSGASINYWDAGLIHVWDNTKDTFADGLINKLYTSLPSGVSISNPSFSKNSPYIVAYDYYDANINQHSIVAANIESNKQNVITKNAVYGYPTFSRNDDYIAYTSLDSKNDTVIVKVPVKADKIEANGSPSVLINNAKWPVWYTRGLRVGVGAEFAISKPAFCQDASTTFTDVSIGDVSSYSWNFGAGATPATDTTSGPHKVSYSSSGNKTVSLTVKDRSGHSNTTSHIVTVAILPKPVIQEAGGLLNCKSAIAVQWFLNDTAIQGATGATYTPTRSGSYTVLGKNTSGCTGMSAPYAYRKSDIKANETFIDHLVIQPNPSQGYFAVGFISPTPLQNAQLTVMDILGNVVYKELLNVPSGASVRNIDMQGFNSGIYFLRIQQDNKLVTQKLMITK